MHQYHVRSIVTVDVAPERDAQRPVGYTVNTVRPRLLSRTIVGPGIHSHPSTQHRCNVITANFHDRNVWWMGYVQYVGSIAYNRDVRSMEYCTEGRYGMSDGMCIHTEYIYYVLYVRSTWILLVPAV